jgi:hypothetical protein
MVLDTFSIRKQVILLGHLIPLFLLQDANGLFAPLHHPSRVSHMLLRFRLIIVN